MALETLFANFVYHGDYQVEGEGKISVPAEIHAVRPIAVTTGYVSFVWSAKFFIQGLQNCQDGYYDENLHKPISNFGWYEVRQGDDPIMRFKLDAETLATPKVNGIAVGPNSLIACEIYTQGSGGTTVSVNNASDRPYRGDTLYYCLNPLVSASVCVAINTGFVDNAGNTNRYLIHP